MEESTTVVIDSRSPIVKSFASRVKNRAFDFTILSLFFIGLFFIFISSNSGVKPLFFFDTTQISSMFNYKTIQGDELDVVLAETCMENKTLIIAVVNKAYVEGDKPMFDLFLDGFWYGNGTQALVRHLLIVACDQVSYQRCKFLGLHCYKLETEGVNFEGEKAYMSEDFNKMMWRRTLFLGDVLKRGYNFIFTDTDILWLRNPFLILNTNGTIDLQISTDAFLGDEWLETNPINTGFFMVRSNNKTIALFDSWYAEKERAGRRKEQDMLKMLISGGLIGRIGLKVRFLNTLYFSGFCQTSRDVRAVVTVHSNCCITISAKLIDLTAAIHDWKKGNALPANETSTFRWSRHEACGNAFREASLRV